jgi:hypothetical protein
MELVKVKFKGGWAFAEPADVGKGIYELYVEPVEEEIPVGIPEEEEEVIIPPVEVKKNVPDSRGRNRRK